MGADPLGPPVSHGLESAPGYGPDQFDAAAQRAFRSATLQDTPGFGMFYWSGIELPTADPSSRELEGLADAAVRLAGHVLPATPVVTVRRDIRNEDSTQRTWSVGFTRSGARLSPAGCVLRVESGKTSCARLSCRIPEQTVTRFEPFVRPEAVALAQGRRASQLVRPQATDVTRLYVASGGLAQARFYVILSNGLHERLVVLDGAANVLTVGDNTREFTFRGYEPDYLTAPQRLDAAIPVGAGQEILDTASAQPNRVSCQRFGGTTYATGFAMCHNDALRDDTGAYTQNLVAPRPDFDFDNPPSGLDPLPPQELFFYTQVPGAQPAQGVHNTLTQVTGRPIDLTALRGYARILPGQEGEQPYGPAHHAELQGYYNMAKLQKFYSFFDPRFSPGGQDRFRTEVTVHWRPQLDGLMLSEFNGGRAGRFMLQMPDMRHLGTVTYPSAIDGTGEFGIFAHEYHHHIQESLAKDDAWTRFPGFGVLFPHEPVTCSPLPDCRRRVQILEGIADGFGALGTGRGVIGTATRPLDPLASVLASCNDREGYEDGAANDTGRRLCNNFVFGAWHFPQGPTVPEECKKPLNPQYDSGARQQVIGGALYLYQERFREAGIGPVIYGQHMLEAQRKLKQLTDNELHYLSGLVDYLQSQPSVLTRRYQHTARAAFAEKGVFSLVGHLWAAGAAGSSDVGLDDLYSYRCSPANCTTAGALGLSAATLTASGPLRWNFDPNLADVPIPTFDVFAPGGSSYENLGLTQNRVWLEFSDAVDFTSGAFFERVPVVINTANRGVNCAPPGFARPTPPDGVWRDAVRAAAEADGRVYYRLRQCLSGVPVDDANGCVVSTTATSPAFTTVSFQGSGCSCEVPGAPGDGQSRSGALLALALGALWRRRRRRAV